MCCTAHGITIQIQTRSTTHTCVAGRSRTCGSAPAALAGLSAICPSPPAPPKAGPGGPKRVRQQAAAAPAAAQEARLLGRWQRPQRGVMGPARPCEAPEPPRKLRVLAATQPHARGWEEGRGPWAGVGRSSPAALLRHNWRHSPDRVAAPCLPGRTETDRQIGGVHAGFRGRRPAACITRVGWGGGEGKLLARGCGSTARAVAAGQRERGSVGHHHHAGNTSEAHLPHDDQRLPRGRDHRKVVAVAQQPTGHAPEARPKWSAAALA